MKRLSFGKLYYLVGLLIIASMLLSSCASPTPTTAPVTSAPVATSSVKAAGDITIAYSGYAKSNDYWNGLGKAAAAEAAAKGVKFVDLTTETQDAAAQKAAVDTEITAKPSAIIIGSVDPTVWKDTLAAAKAAGIPVLAADTAIADPYISALVQTDNLTSSQNLGDYVCKLLNGAKGSALVMAGTVGHQTGDARQKGIADKLAACGETVIKQYGDWDENKEVQIATDTMTATPDLNVIFAPHGAGAAAVATVVKSKGMTGKIMVFGFDGLPVEFTAIKAGDQVATMKQDNIRIGQETVDDAIAIVNGQTLANPSDLIPGVLIDKTNVDKYMTPSAAQPAKNPADITIAYSGYAKSNDYWNGLGKAAAAEAAAKGVKFVDLTTETQDAAAQKAAVDTEITAKPSAIIIGSVDPTVWKDTLAAAKAAGIPVLAADTAIADPYISALVQTDNLTSSQNLGDYVCKLLNGAKGSALVMAGTVGHQTGDARQKGIADKLAACGETVIKQYGDWDENKEVQIATDTMTATPDLNVIFAPHGAGAAAVATVVKSKGMTGKIMVFGFDGLPVEFTAIKAGTQVATMKQDNIRIGQETVDDAIAIVNGQTLANPSDLIPGVLIDKTNVDKYMTPSAAQPAKNPAEITIAYSGYAKSNDYWNGLGKAAAAEAAAKGVKFVDLTTETQDAAAQKAAVDTEITAKPSAIIIGSVDPTVWKDTLAAAKAAGIPVLAADTAIADPYISALVQTDNLTSSQNLGDYVCKLLNGAKGSALVMAGTVGHQTGDARQKGIADKLAACGETVIKQYGDWDENKEVQIATDTMTATPDLNVIFAPHGAGAAAVATVVKSKGMTGKIMVFGFDGLPVEFTAIKAGTQVATMKQDNIRIGQETVDDAIAIVNGLTLANPSDLIPGVLIDMTNVDKYMTP